MSLESVGNFWQYHGIGFCIAMFLFPRITMIFASICSMAFAGPLFWLGWIFVPRLTVAILATSFYFHSNPILCVFVWFWAFSLEIKEKNAIKSVCKK